MGRLWTIGAEIHSGKPLGSALSLLSAYEALWGGWGWRLRAHAKVESPSRRAVRKGTH